MLMAVLMSFLLWNVASADASVSIGPSNGVLKITGDAENNVVVLRRASDPSFLEFELDGDFVFDGTVPMGSFGSISASMGSGRDAFRIDDDGGSFTDTKPTTIVGGDGNDVLSGGKGAEVILAGDGNDLVIADRGNDVIDGGPGDDTIVWQAADGADSVAGGLGFDLVAAIGTNEPEDFAVVEEGTEPSLLRNSVEVLDMLGVERIDLQANGGSDRITADPGVGKLINLTLGAGTGLGLDNDVVIGSDSADVITGGGGSDRLEGRAGDDKIFGDEGDDLLIGGAGTDSLTGGAGKDTFECDLAGEARDLELVDQTVGPCIAPPEPQEPELPPAPPADQPQGTAEPQGSVEPAPSASLPAAFLGFAKPAVSATREGLRVRLRNTSGAAITVSFRAAERFGTRRAVRYRILTKTIAAGGRVAMRLRAPRRLRQRIARRLDRLGRVVRRPSVAVTNVATAGKTSVRPRLTMTAR